MKYGRSNLNDSCWLWKQFKNAVSFSNKHWRETINISQWMKNKRTQPIHRNKLSDQRYTILWQINTLGTGHYLWWGVTPKRNVFLGTIFADPIIKKSKKILANLKYQLKNKNPPPAKNFKKDTIQLSHMSLTTSVTWVWELLGQFSAI